METIDNKQTDFEIYGFILAKYHGRDKVVTVPEGVTVIDQSAFYGCFEMEEVILPKGVTRIERSAFAECQNLKRVALPLGLDAIGDTAFENCQKLVDIELPLSLQYIGRMAFAKCLSLQKITIPKNVTRLQYGVFMANSSLETVTLPLYMSSIGECAFYFCKNLKEIFVPESIDGIHPDTFYGCNGLKRGYIPKIILDYYRREEQMVFTTLYLSGQKHYLPWEVAMYDKFVETYKTELCEHLLKIEAVEAMNGLLDKQILSAKEMDVWIDKARRAGKVEFTAKLLQEKNLRFATEDDMWDI